MLATAIYQGLRTSGLTALARRARRGGVILCYHNVVEVANGKGEPGVHMEVERFRSQMRWLSRHYAVLPLGEFAERVRRGKSTRGCAAVTFDDGYLGVFDFAWPIVQAMGLPATVFVPTALSATDAFWWDEPAVVDRTTPVERKRWLTEYGGDRGRITTALSARPERLPPSHRLAPWDRIARAAREGLEVGAHTATHRNLTVLDDASLHRETAGSRDALAARIDAEVCCFSYPYGLSDARVRDAVRAAGYETAVTLDFGLNTDTSDPLALRRMNVPASISAAAFEAWVAGLRPRVGETT